MAENSPKTPAELRPYRSHKTPACDLCRSRKVRCHVDVAGQSCRFCRERKSRCLHSNANGTTAGSSRPSGTRPAKRRRRDSSPVTHSVAAEGNDLGNVIEHFPSVVGASPTETSLLLNPTMAEDIEVLEKYLTSNPSASASVGNPYSVVSNIPGKPIIYLNVPKHRKGLRTPIDPGKTQREILDQILRPFQTEILEIYFDNLHPCFPIVDKKTFLDLWQKSSQRISSTLVCDIYAAALLYWHRSDVLKHHAQPDLEFVWNQAVSALQDDFMAPSISTIYSALLDLVGRPIVQISGNIVNCGRLVTLAHSLGLHRDITGWNATDHEKLVRINLWWGCLIHDHWASLAHGTPPNVIRANYDVPMPTLASLLAISSVSGEESTAAMSFIKLCSLTQILGNLLPLVYSLQQEEDDAWKKIRRLECSLDEWEASLPGYLNLGVGGNTENVNGSSNLWFCLLSVKLLLCRITFKMTAAAPQTSIPEAKQYRLALLRNSALVLVDFITALKETQLDEFWLPYTAHLLVSAATILLRCIVESNDVQTKRECALKLTWFQSRLETARDASRWDLAEFCLDRCSQTIEKIATALKVSNCNIEEHTEGSLQVGAHVVDIQNQVAADMVANGLDFLLPPDSLEFPWENLWDIPDGSLPLWFENQTFSEH